jgi:potassium-transporting ATPase KdpC subunit
MKTLITSIKIFLLLTVITGIAYPLFLTGIAQVFFPSKANGSIVYRNEKAVGSKLIGQQFDTLIYFSSRPSAINYNPLPSGGSNYGITNSRLKQQVEERRNKFINFNQLSSSVDVPSEMLFASGSGLDPHISVKAAQLQTDRISEARHFNAVQKQELVNLVKKHTEAPKFKILGEERVNVFLLNLDLDKIK